MKNLIALSVLSIVLPFTVQAKVLVSANTLKINSPDGLTKLSTISASISAYCKYKSGIFFPESKSCGRKNLELAVSKDGVINLPEIETFSGAHGNNFNNYDVSVTIYDGNGPLKEYLGSMSAYGKNAITAFGNNKKELNVLRFKGANLTVSKDGANFFGSELSKNIDAYLLLSVSSTTTDNTLNEIMVSSSMENYLMSLENKNLYGGKNALKDAVDLKIPDTNLVYLGDQKDIKLKVRLTVYLNQVGSHTEQVKAEITIPATSTALPDLANIELK